MSGTLCWNIAWKIENFLAVDFEVNSCAICRGRFENPCLDCQANREEEISKPSNVLKRWCKDVWLILLWGQKQKESLLSKLDRFMLRHIYRFVIGHHIEPSWLCPIARPTQCHHVYHMHCWDRWTAKRAVCPLDNIAGSRIDCLFHSYIVIKGQVSTAVK